MTTSTVGRAESTGAARGGKLPKRAIVAHSSSPVKSKGSAIDESTSTRRRKKARRQSNGSAWHWSQTDSWYYTLPGTKRRVPLFDEDGNRVRGVENKKAAQLAMARVKLGQGLPEAPPASPDDWMVAKVCSEYLQYCERGVANGSVSKAHRDGTNSLLNDLCKFCGALPVAQMKKVHVKTWLDSHEGWKSPATHRSAISVVLAAFNYSQENHDVLNPLKGLKKPQARPRLQSLSQEDEQALYTAAEKPFKEFLFAAIHTGLRPFCELAKLTADDVEETPRGIMWRVYSSKTKKTRKIPVQPEVAKLTRELMKSAPRGSAIPLFRSMRGKSWSKVNGVMRFIDLREKLGWDKDAIRKKFSSYSCRHTFAHRMLSGYWAGGSGCSLETLAELIGDTPKVACDHYGKEWGQQLPRPTLGCDRCQATMSHPNEAKTRVLPFCQRRDPSRGDKNFRGAPPRPQITASCKSPPDRLVSSRYQIRSHILRSM